MQAAAGLEEPAGGHGHGHRIDVSFLPLKKRASNDTTNGSYYASPPPKKRRVDAGDVGAESKNAAGEAPVAAAASSSLEPAETTKAFSSTVKWVEKGKWVPPPNQQASRVVVSPPPEKKLMHDAIRSSSAHLNDRRHAARDEAKNRRRHHQSVVLDAPAPPPPPRSSPPRPRDGAVARVYADADDLGPALALRLAELNATRPWSVYRKPLRKSDVCPNQNRLLVSCKRETLEGCPITACFTRAEWRRVENKDAGLLVTALDREGRPHRLTCKFLDSNGGYRFITGWKEFLSGNGMGLDSRGRWTRDVDVEIRAFRSKALPRQPELDERGRPVRKDTGEHKDEYVEVADHFDEEGSLGLILLHYENKRRRADEDDDEDYHKVAARPPPVARDKGKKQREKQDAAAPSPAAGAEAMSKVEMVDKYGDSTSKAVIGLIMLRGANSKEENVGEGGDMSKESQGKDDVEGGHCVAPE